MPVRQAFQKLRSEGLLVIARGKRPVIGSGKLPWNFQELRGFSEEMKRRGLQPSAKVLSLELPAPEVEVAQALKLEEGANVYCLKRLRYVDGEPVAVVTSYLPMAILPEIQSQDLEGQSLYRIFEHIYKRRLRWAEEVIGAATANEDDAKVLQAAVGSAVLLIKETTYDSHETPIEYSVSVLRGDRYMASVISVRKIDEPSGALEDKEWSSGAGRSHSWVQPQPRKSAARSRIFPETWRWFTRTYKNAGTAKHRARHTRPLKLWVQ
jgi:GntR family transcriptional regulator